ncbi:MAG: hypothetical protein H7X93_07540 [Sphingomonadaceae bacterium]|nr:hypothetical protein [Sphingomonadaceae bacterium]
MLAELFARQPALAGFALLSLVGCALTATLMALDARLIGDVSVWLKPTKFFLSIAVFAGTMAWFFGAVRPERRASRLMRATVVMLIATASFELAWISWQGAHGQASHFNFDTPLTQIMYSLMGVAAVLLVGTTLPMAWEIARRPIAGIDPGYRLAVVLGLVLTFALGGSLGGYISANGGATVGAHASDIPLFSWNRIGGDLRIAHFLGIHAQQAMPALAGLLIMARVRMRAAILVVAATGYAALTLLLWRQAAAGIPLIGA